MHLAIILLERNTANNDCIPNHLDITNTPVLKIVILFKASRKYFSKDSNKQAKGSVTN